jgi:ferric iron reductase protein FhuF
VVVTHASLAETFERLTVLDPFLGAVVRDLGDDSSGWTVADVAAHLEDAFEAIGRAWNTTDRRVQAAFFVNDYTWRLAAPAIASFLLARRVPALDHVSVRMALDRDGAFIPPVFRSTAYAGILGDAGAAPILDEDGLLRLLRRRLEEHLGPVVSEVRRAAPLGVRAQWALIGDACGSSFLHAGEAVGDVVEARRAAERFLSLDGEPLQAKQRFFILRHDGRSETFMVRGSCCLSYKIEGNAYCATCPFTSDGDRMRQLRDWMASPD